MDHEIEMTPEMIQEVAEKVVGGVMGNVEKTVAARLDEVTEKLAADFDEKLAKFEEVTKKVSETTTEEPKVAKEVRFMQAAIALKTGDSEVLKGYNQSALEARTKAGWQNETVNADGKYLIADPEFEAEIERLENEYGVAFREASVRQLSSNKVKTNKLGSNVTMYEVGEGIKKPLTKLTINQIEVELRKFAAIVIATDELIEDSAIDFWAEVAEGFAMERARIADELVFTDSTVGKEGLLNYPGIPVLSVGSTTADFDWDDMMDAEVAVPSVAARNGKHYLHRTMWNIVRQTKASSAGSYMVNLSAGLVTPWGTPVVLADVLPASSQVGSNNPFGVFGDLKRVRLYVKRGLQLALSNEATITGVEDAEGNTINLWEQNMTAMRAETRMVALIKSPEAFVVYGTGTVS